MNSERTSPSAITLPSSVCVRVTRACNARCGFCLAPPRGHGVTFESITRRLGWLASIGVRKVNLSGGEPTIRSDLPQIIERVQNLGLVCAMTTNGIRLSDPLLERLREADVKVKVSLHGPKELHDRMLGTQCFDRVERNIGRLLDRGISLAIQTVITRLQPEIHTWAIAYCSQRRIRKLRFVPFVPRGRGMMAVDAYQLDPDQRDRLEEAIHEAKRQQGNRLDIDILDFWIQEYFVLETDGELQIQRETDTSDSIVLRVDDTPISVT